MPTKDKIVEGKNTIPYIIRQNIKQIKIQQRNTLLKKAGQQD